MDHRVVDGDDVALFERRVEVRLEPLR